MIVVTIKFPNGDWFEVPGEIIAKSRTEYYAGIDGFKEGTKEWNDEYKQSMSHYELFQWLGNNMDWKDVEPYATKVRSGNTMYVSMWHDIIIETNDKPN